MPLDPLNEKLSQSQQPVIIEFWAPWCGPCKMMEPALKSTQKEYQGRVELWRLNVDEDGETARTLGIMGVPTLIIFAKGKELSRRTGAQSPEAIKSIFEAALNEQPLKSFSLLDGVKSLFKR